MRGLSRSLPPRPGSVFRYALREESGTVSFSDNSTGQPAISIPNGFSKAGLPLALQIVGRPGDEAGIIALASEFERARPWKDRHPPI